MSVIAAAPVPRRPLGSLGSLREDDGGAVMLIGLCMACFLIGALWFVIGIGDAMVFRDSMQEVADHAAFTSAVLHAKGMNFIAASNLMLLGMIAVHVMMGVMNDAALIAAVAAAIPSGGQSMEIYKAFNDAYVAYGKSFKPAARAIHKAELAAAYGYPVLGYEKGRSLGNDYAGFAPRARVLDLMTISPSMIPGGQGDSGIAGIFTQAGNPGPSIPETKRKALPVEAHKFAEVCEKVAKLGPEALSDMAGSGDSSATAAIGSLGASGIKARYCNEQGNSGGSDPGQDSFWGEDGPLYPWAGTRNGSSWQDVWSINAKPRFEDLQEHAVGIAQGKLGLHQTAKQPPAYIAQAEFYFDCAGKWADAQCNGDDNAAYSVRWRARLKPLNLDLVGALVRQHASRFFESCPEAQQVGVEPASGNPGKMTEAINGCLELLKK